MQPPDERPIFRQSALSRFSSPEPLDQLLHIMVLRVWPLPAYLWRLRHLLAAPQGRKTARVRTPTASRTPEWFWFLPRVPRSRNSYHHSTLDHATRAIVVGSVARLHATRIVIAHRLSTVLGADRIVVMEAGKIRQVGTYGELMREDGVFKRLAERRMV